MLSKIKSENSFESLVYFSLKFVWSPQIQKLIPFSATMSLTMKMDTVGIYYGVFGMPVKLLKWTIYTKNLQR